MAINSFSSKSRTRLRRYLANCVADYTVMVTLTYPAAWPKDGRQCKRHLHRFRKLLTLAGMMPSSICWFLEFQSRGAPHFHLLSTGYLGHQAVAQLWARATLGLASLDAGTSVVGVQGGSSAYALKSYGAKREQKEVPADFLNVGRFWGVWGMADVKPVVATTLPVADELADFMLKRQKEQLIDAGMTVFDVPYGVVAFPGGKNG